VIKISSQIKFDLDVKQLYNELCENCKKKLIEQVRNALTDSVVKNALGLEQEQGGV